MLLIENYIFRRMLRAFFLTLLVLSATVWLSQALRQFDLVANMGQTVLTFVEVSILLLPALATAVTPPSLLIAVIYTFRTLNDGSELVVINASGAPQGALLKPVLLTALIAAILTALMTLYFSPLALQKWREMITNVRGNFLTTILREGQFMSLAPNLTFHLSRRNTDGTLQGIFLSDGREPQTTITYLAERGAVLDNPLGVFLVMANGTIQKRDNKNNSISIIEFSSYAFDLSSFSSQASVPPLRPQERSTAYLLNPSPDDKFFQKYPGKFRSELHTRLSTPLLTLVFAIIPLVFLGQAETTRQQRSATIGMAVMAVLGIGVIDFVLAGASEESLAAAALMYLVPLFALAVSVFLILIGKQPKPPERLLALGDIISGRARSLFRRREASA
ncbi:MAG: LPS export ABC transporter permease LptF [Rhizobiales bacterium]|nr:LPS export ABC transporter permease LptF [Hyphomicrobiales bacterium]